MVIGDEVERKPGFRLLVALDDGERLGEAAQLGQGLVEIDQQVGAERVGAACLVLRAEHLELQQRIDGDHVLVCVARRERQERERIKAEKAKAEARERTTAGSKQGPQQTAQING